MNILGKNLKKLREERGLSQSELAKKTGTSRQYISNLENGKVMSLNMLGRIVDALDVEPAILFMTPKARKQILKTGVNK